MKTKLVIRGLLEGYYLQTNEVLSLADLHKMYDGRSMQQTTTQKLPSHYERVAELPKNDFNIDVELHYPEWAWGFLLPPAFVTYLVTFPFQIPLIKM